MGPIRQSFKRLPGRGVVRRGELRRVAAEFPADGDGALEARAGLEVQADQTPRTGGRVPDNLGVIAQVQQIPVGKIRERQPGATIARDVAERIEVPG